MRNDKKPVSRWKNKDASTPLPSSEGAPVRAGGGWAGSGGEGPGPRGHAQRARTPATTAGREDVSIRKCVRGTVQRTPAPSHATPPLPAAVTCLTPGSERRGRAHARSSTSASRRGTAPSREAANNDQAQDAGWTESEVRMRDPEQTGSEVRTHPLAQGKHVPQSQQSARRVDLSRPEMQGHGQAWTGGRHR